MCGCEKHHNKRAKCTCICPEHGNFQAAYDLAMRRYDQIKEAKAERDDARRTAETMATLANKRATERDDLRARLAAIERVLDNAEPTYHVNEYGDEISSHHEYVAADDLRAALATDTHDVRDDLQREFGGGS